MRACLTPSTWRNGDHHFPAEYVADKVALFYGKAMLILRTDEGAGGEIRVEAKAEGLAPARAAVASRPGK